MDLRTGLHDNVAATHGRYPFRPISLEAKTMAGSFLDKAFADRHLRLDQSGRTEKIVYVAVNRSERWSEPEEKVRAEFYAELIYRYGYSPDRIGVEITAPDRSPNDFADLVVFRDD